MCAKGTRGGSVPYVRTARVQVAVAEPTGIVAGKFVLVGTSNVAVIPVSIATAVVGLGVSVSGDKGVAKRFSVIAVGGRDVFVGCAVSVCATAICKFACSVPATFTTGVGLVIGDRAEQELIKNTTATARMTFFISPSF